MYKWAWYSRKVFLNFQRPRPSYIPLTRTRSSRLESIPRTNTIIHIRKSKMQATPFSSVGYFTLEISRWITKKSEGTRLWGGESFFVYAAAHTVNKIYCTLSSFGCMLLYLLYLNNSRAFYFAIAVHFSMLWKNLSYNGYTLFAIYDANIILLGDWIPSKKIINISLP